MTRSASDLVIALMDAPVPRPAEMARDAANRLFPLWQALLVGVPITVMAAAVLGIATSLAVALPLGTFVMNPKPAWFGHVSEAAMLPGVAIAVWLVVRWMRGRRAQFAMLARDGVIVPARDVAATGLAGALGTGLGAAAARVALGGVVGGTVAQVYGGPIAVAELDGTIVEARTAAGTRGRFRVPELMLVSPAVRYVAFIDRDGWIAPQRVLRRRPAITPG